MAATDFRRATASILFLVGLTLGPTDAAAQTSPSHEIRERIEAYDQVFNSGKRSELGGFYDTGATIFQDAKAFTGFQEYLDRYLEPTFRNVWPIQLSHTPRHVVLLGKDRTSAYVVSTFTLTSGKEQASGVETLILVKDPKAGWRIRHAQISTTVRPPQ